MKNSLRKVMSIVLCAALLLTSFVFFDVSQLKAKAAYATLTHNSEADAKVTTEWYYPEGTTFLAYFALGADGNVFGGLSYAKNRVNEGKSGNKGYSVWNLDLSNGAGGNWVAIGFKYTQNIAEAMRDIGVVQGQYWTGITYKGMAYTGAGQYPTSEMTGDGYDGNSGYVNLNKGNSGTEQYLVATKDKFAGAPITAIDYELNNTVNDATNSANGINIPVKVLYSINSSSPVGSVANMNDGNSGTPTYFFYGHSSTEVDSTALRTAYNNGLAKYNDGKTYTESSKNDLVAAMNSAWPTIAALDAYAASTSSQANIDQYTQDINNAIASLEVLGEDDVDSNMELQNNKIYRVTTNKTLYGDGKPALRVAEKAVTCIYIAPGCTLTCNGASGSGQNGGYAGIEVPASSTLIITGGGTLVANGGAGGSSTSGYGGGTFNGAIQGEAFDRWNRVNNWNFIAGGGPGGNGAGSPGAGIGANGVRGGDGGAMTANYPIQTGSANIVSSTTDYRKGENGNDGSAGANGNSMGDLYVLGDMTVTAAAGSRNTTLSSGGGAGWTHENRHSASWWTATTGGAGGGGGGCSGTSANIGGAGGAGGGGGAGATGARYNGTGGASFAMGASGGGAGGGGGYGGTASTKRDGSGGQVPTDFSDYKLPSNGSSNTYLESTAGSAGGEAGYCNFNQDMGSGRRYAYGGAGGNGGNRGTGGSGGNLYLASGIHRCSESGGGSTSLGNGAGATVISSFSTPTLVARTITYNCGTVYTSAGTQRTDEIYGTFTTSSITPPTRTGYIFEGYFTEPNGAGTMVYKADGDTTDSTRRYLSNSNVTYYAKWTPITYTVKYIATDSGMTGSTESSAHTYDVSSDLTLNGFTREHYEFAGWATSNGGEAVYVDGESVSNLTSENGSTINLYAVWDKEVYNITFKDDDGTVLYVAPTEYNDMPVYGGETPTKASDDDNEYSFNDWSSILVPATEDTTYTATYTETPHDFTKIESISDTHHHYICKNCGYVKPESNEIHTITYESQGASGHKEKCDVCGYISEEISHNLVYGKDENGHWQYCTKCDYKSETVEHTFEVKSNADGHWNHCTVCGYDEAIVPHTTKLCCDDEYHWYESEDGCGYVSAKIAHTVIVAKNDTQHYKYCSVCRHEYAFEDHTYKVTNDYNDDTHKLVCSGCGNEIYERHVIKDDGSGECEICDYVAGDLANYDEVRAELERVPTSNEFKLFFSDSDENEVRYDTLKAIVNSIYWGYSSGQQETVNGLANSIRQGIAALDLKTYKVYGVDESQVSFQRGDHEHYMIATVSAPMKKDGKYFSYWVDENNKVVSTYLYYSFYSVADRTLTPVYEGYNIDPEYYISSSVAGVRNNLDGTYSILVEHSASARISINMHGVYYTYDGTKKDGLGKDSYDYAAVASSKTATTRTGLFEVKITAPADASSIYVMPYVIEDGTTEYTYGMPENGTMTRSTQADSFGLGEMMATSSISVISIETFDLETDSVEPGVSETEPTIEPTTEPTTEPATEEPIISQETVAQINSFLDWLIVVFTRTWRFFEGLLRKI